MGGVRIFRVMPIVEYMMFISVGAGSAGCILAARLAENAAHRVLLIEAGGRPSPLIDIPLSAPMLQLTPYDWQFKTLPQHNACLGMKEQVNLIYESMIRQFSAPILQLTPFDWQFKTSPQHNACLSMKVRVNLIFESINT